MALEERRASKTSFHRGCKSGGSGALTATVYIPRADQWEVHRCLMTGLICVLSSVEYKKETKSMWGDMCTNKNNNTKPNTYLFFKELN